MISRYQYLSKHHHNHHDRRQRPTGLHPPITVSLHSSKSAENGRERTQVCFGCDVVVKYFCDQNIFRAAAENSLDSFVEEFRDSAVYPILLNPFAVRFFHSIFRINHLNYFSPSSTSSSSSFFAAASPSNGSPSGPVPLMKILNISKYWFGIWFDSQFARYSFELCHKIYWAIIPTIAKSDQFLSVIDFLTDLDPDFVNM